MHGDPAPPDPRAGPAWAEQLVRFLDDGLLIPGTRYRVGFDGVIGLLLPGAGDAISAVSALSLFWLAVQRGVPRLVLTRMALNVAIDSSLGAIPILGDLFDFAWKANRRNLQLIERASRPDAARRTSASDYVVLGLFGLLVLSAIALPLVLVGLLVSGFRN